jgi:virginiamycin B lyase
MRALAGTALTFAMMAPIADADESIDIKEWTVPWAQTRPRDPDFVRPDAVWFVGQTGHYLATLNPQTGKFNRINLPDQPGPHTVLVGRDGIVWYAGNLKGYIGRYDPATSAIRKIRMPNTAASDPHTFVFDAGQKNIWFSVQAGNFVGRLNLASEKVDLIRVSTADARPYGIVMARDGTPWIALFGTNKLASVDPNTLALVEHSLPRPDARPRRLGLTTDGRVWYVDFADGYLGVLTPASGAVKEWRLPGGADSRPYGMAVDAQDRIWAVEVGSQPNRIVGFDPKKEQFFGATPIPSGAGAIRNMDYDAEGGRVWFGTDANTIGYAKVD